MDMNYDVKKVFSKYFYFKKAVILADITKISTFFIKTIFIDSRKLK